MRRRGLKSQITNYKLQIGEGGYVLITLMLFVALLTIAALAALPAVRQQIKRDQEEEMQHRGTAYMRAVQHFYKKTGRYPGRIEELENTNNIRFLRKRYKDPITGKDFKLLHMGDKELNVLGGGMGMGLGGQIPGQMPGQSQLPGQSPFQGQLGGVIQTALNRQPGGLSQQAAAAQPDDSGNATNASGAQGADASENNPSNQATPGASASGPLQANPASGNNPLTFGGGPILGVTSVSKDKSIREFGDKIKHYNEWLFVYDPTADRGGLIKGPVVPNSLTGGGMGTPAGAVANQSQGGASRSQPQNPSPMQQGLGNQQAEPPEEQ